jgi:WD40 repeat protein
VLDLEFSPDGSILASGGRDLVTKLWDVATRDQIANLETIHRSRAIAFSPDGGVLYSIGNGGNVTLWDVPTHNEIAMLPAAVKDSGPRWRSVQTARCSPRTIPAYAYGVYPPPRDLSPVNRSTSQANIG